VDDKDRPYGVDFSEIEMLEYSCCNIPANPDALVAAKSAGIDTNPLRKWAEEVIDTYKSIDDKQVQKEVLEIHQALSTTTLSIPAKIKAYQYKLNTL
jgi:hypothetical protein